MDRLLIVPALDSPRGYPGFYARYLNADEEIRKGERVRLVRPREATTVAEENDYTSPRANLRLMEGICLSVGDVVTTLGMPSTGASVDGADARVLLDVEEGGLQTVALESREGIPRIRFMRTMGNVGTPVALASKHSIDVDKAFPPVVPGYRYDRWTRLNDLESFFADPVVDLAVGFRDADYILPLRCVARDRRRLEKALAYVRTLPTCEIARPWTEREGHDDGRTFLDYEAEE